MEDKREIRKNITILALDNLIQNYTNALEDKDMDPPLSNEERELSELIIKEAKEMLTEWQSKINQYQDHHGRNEFKNHHTGYSSRIKRYGIYSVYD